MVCKCACGESFRICRGVIPPIAAFQFRKWSKRVRVRNICEYRFTRSTNATLEGGEQKQRIGTIVGLIPVWKWLWVDYWEIFMFRLPWRFPCRVGSGVRRGRFGPFPISAEIGKGKHFAKSSVVSNSNVLSRQLWWRGYDNRSQSGKVATASFADLLLLQFM